MQDAEKHNIIPGQKAVIPVTIITTEGLETVRLVTKYPSPAYPDGTHFGLHCSQVIVANGNDPIKPQPMGELAQFLQKNFKKDLDHNLSLEQNAIAIIKKLIE